MYKTIRRALALLIAVALTATLAACASKPTDPPDRLSDKEIAKLREQYPYISDDSEEVYTHYSTSGVSLSEARKADMLDMMSLNWWSGVILEVEIIGEIEEMRTSYTTIYHRSARIIDVIASNSNYVLDLEFVLGDDIYLGSAKSLIEQLPIGSRLFVFGGIQAIRIINEKPRVRIGGIGMFIQAEGGYMLSKVAFEGYDKYTGMTADNLKVLLAAAADSWGWNDPEVYKAQTDIYWTKIGTIEIEKAEERLKTAEDRYKLAIESGSQEEIAQLEERLEQLKVDLESKKAKLDEWTERVKEESK
jgi:hypothetical protein